MNELISTLVILWLLFWLLDLVLNGRWWLWELVSMIPGWTILLTFMLLILATGLSGNHIGLFLLLVSCWLPLRVVDIRFPTNQATESSGSKAIRLVNWNTQFWHYYADSQKFSQILKANPAHIYHLQEAMDFRGIPKDVTAELSQVFSDHAIVQHGELVTITNLPIRQIHKISKSILRLDLEVDNKLISIYNVHLPVQIELRFKHSASKFLGWVRTAFKLRRAEFATLYQELAQNTLPCVVSGDFNTPKTLLGIRPLLRTMADAYSIASAGGIYPATYTLKSLNWWRIDYILGTKVKFTKYDSNGFFPLFDHHLLQAEFTLVRPKT